MEKSMVFAIVSEQNMFVCCFLSSSPFVNCALVCTVVVEKSFGVNDNANIPHQLFSAGFAPRLSGGVAGAAEILQEHCPRSLGSLTRIG